MYIYKVYHRDIAGDNFDDMDLETVNIGHTFIYTMLCYLYLYTNESR